tara:strand:- start:869 stop:1615 length:747 start_codon:yes stop_codon:yes gene_type:complete
MSKINVNAVAPSATGTTLTLGTTGDSVTIPTGGTLKTDKIADAGGNSIISSDGSGGLTIDSQMSGSLSLVSSQTFSGQASVEFKASAITNFNTAYPIYWVKVINIIPSSTGGTLRIGFSNDDGSSYTGFNKTTTFMRWGRSMDGTGIAPAVQNTFDLDNSSGDPYISTADNIEADLSWSGDIWLWNFGSSTLYKHYSSRIIGQYGATTAVTMYDEWSSGVLKTTLDIDAFKLLSQSNITGTVNLYGLS